MSTSTRSPISLAVISLVAAGLLSACGKKADEPSSATLSSNSTTASASAPADSPSIDELKAITEEGFIYGLPLVMNYAVMNEYAVDPDSSQFKAPFNQIKNLARVFTYKDTAVITPNSDTPYSFLWTDLRSEPIVVSVPAIPKERYYSVMLADSHTYNYGYIGSRATGNAAGHYMVAGPDWTGDVPEGIDKVFQSATPFSLVVFRTQVFNAADLPNVKQIQAQYKAQPLSAFLGKTAPPPAPKPDFLPATTAGIKENFWAYLDAALEYIPEADEDKAILGRLARVGVGPGKTFDMKDLPEDHQRAIAESMKAGDERVATYLASGMTDVNGWQVGSLPGDRAHYNGDWVKRAATAKAGLYGNNAAEAMYPLTRVDGEGHTLDGSKHDYTLTFPAGQMPPVNAFWSVTMYDGKTQYLIENPINRYLINSPMLGNMKTNADGSLTIYIQKESPGKDKEANWLPAPSDEIYLVMRLYWPKPASEGLSILPAGQGSWQPPGIVVAK